MSTTEIVLACLLSQAGLSVDEVRTTTRGLLQSLCGDQCDVIDVKIKRRPEVPQGSVSPGFDETPRVRTVASEIELTLLFDQKLPKPYRDFVADRVKQRVGEVGLPVLVTQNVRPFPEPPAPPPEPAPAPVPQPPAPPPVIVQPPPAPAPIPEPVKPDLEAALWLKLIEALPLLLGFGLLAWLVLRVLRRFENLLDAQQRPQNDETPTFTPEVVDPEPAPVKTAAPLPPPSLEELAADLRRFRGSTRRLFRRLLLKGDHESVARAVSLLGDFVVQDLSHDPEIKKTLNDAGARTAELLRTAITDEERDETLRTLQAELVADRVAHRSQDVRADLEPLLGWSPESFAAFVNRLDRRLQIVALRHAPGHLTEAYLRGLTPDGRSSMVRRLLEDPAAAPSELEVLAETIGAQGQAALVGGYEADHLIQLLDALPATEQEALVASLEVSRPDYVRRNLGVLPVESALLRVPVSALEVAWSRVSVTDWIDYLRAAPETIRERALASCPKRLRPQVEDELNLRVAADPSKAAAARRQIVEIALTAAPALGTGAGREVTVVERKGRPSREES